MVENTPVRGPAPPRPSPAVPDEATEPSRRRVLALLAERGAHPATVGEIAESLGAHENTTRHHLGALRAVGLVEAGSLPSTGRRGRPATGWLLTERGREATSDTDSAAAEYVALAAAFAERLVERGGDPGAEARAVGRRWGESLVARGLAAQADGVDTLVALLDRLGFSPEREGADPAAVDVPTPEPPVLLVRTCPLLETARRHPDVVCQVHLGLVVGALEESGVDSAGLTLEPFAGPGVCRLALPATAR